MAKRTYTSEEIIHKLRGIIRLGPRYRPHRVR